MVTLTNARVFDGTAAAPRHPRRHPRGAAGSPSIDVAGAGPQDEVIDVGGMTLLPGLITCHLHPDFYKFEHHRRPTPGNELPPGVMMAIGVRTCRVLLESGFTGYVGAACAHDIDAQLKMAIAQDIIPGPAHPGVRSPHRHHRRHEQPGRLVATPATSPASTSAADGPDELRKLVREEISRGVETIKIFASAGHGIPGPHRAQHVPRRDRRDRRRPRTSAAPRCAPTWPTRR